jgi:restriction system protein
LVPRFVAFRTPHSQYSSVALNSSRKVHVLQEDSPHEYVDQLPQLIESANEQAKELLRAAIGDLSWREFESHFLERILDCMGFTEIEITRPSRDGGKDAYCKFRRGILESCAIVSAKHWKTQNVGADEVQRLRGIRGDEDTAIIFTSAGFSTNAKEEARPSQNQRIVVLIDGDLIVETCLENRIGLKLVELPHLFTFTSLHDQR